MIVRQLYAGAIVIFLSLVIIGLFNQPASAFSEEELHNPNTSLRLNLAGDADESPDFLGPREFDFHIGADKRQGRGFEIENLYSSNLNIESSPVEIGRFRLRF